MRGYFPSLRATETLRGPVRRDGEARRGRADAVRAGLARTIRSVWALVAACVALAALSLLFPSTPTYDPWAWLIWGREITELDLNTETGPSWKPLPVLFTTLFAPFGDAAPALWLVVGRTGGFLALVMAYRLASRLAGEGLLGVLAGVVASVGLLLTTGWVRHVGLGNAEGLLVALVLWAVERHLVRARTQAFALGFAAALLRPEIWPFLALYAVFIWRAEPRARRLVGALLLLIPILWFGSELWGSGDPLRSSSRARSPNAGSAAFADRPSLEVLRLMGDLVAGPITVAALIALAAAPAFPRRRRGQVVLVLGIAGAAWVALVAVMTEAGYAGNPRYLVLAGAVACVLAGVGVVHLVEGAASTARRLSLPGRGTAVVSVGVVIALLAAAGPFTLPRARAIPDTLDALRSQAELYADVGTAVRRAGGAESVLACGRPITGNYRVPVLAWHLHVHLDDVEFEFHPLTPGVIFYARGKPRLPGSKSRYALRAVAGEWQILAACPAGK